MLDTLKNAARRALVRTGKELQGLDAKLADLKAQEASQIEVCQKLSLAVVSEPDSDSGALQEAESCLAKLTLEIARLERARVHAISQDGVRASKVKAQEAENRARRERAAYSNLEVAAENCQSTISTLGFQSKELSDALVAYAEFATGASDLTRIKLTFKEVLFRHCRSMGLHSAMVSWTDQDFDLRKYLPTRKEPSSGK